MKFPLLGQMVFHLLFRENDLLYYGMLLRVDLLVFICLVYELTLCVCIFMQFYVFKFYTSIMLWLHMQLYFLLSYCIASCLTFSSLRVMLLGTCVMYWMCCLSGTSGVVYPLNLQ